MTGKSAGRDAGPFAGVFVFHRSTRTEQTVTGIFEGISEIGGPLVPPGASSYNAATGTYRITSSGYNIWYQRAELRFLWRRVQGDVSLGADVRFEHPEPLTDRKLVIAIRQTLEDDSKEAVVAEHASSMVHLAERDERGAMMKDRTYTFGGSPKWTCAMSTAAIRSHPEHAEPAVPLAIVRRP